MSSKRLLTPGLLAALILMTAGPASAEKKVDYQLELQPAPKGEPSFQPPARDDMPDGPYGEMVRRGRDIFVNTQDHAGQYVGNGMNCANCHLDEGRAANSAPLWGAMGQYPKYRKKNDMVNTIQNRIQGCFKYSMNGTAPDVNNEVMTALVSYGWWLSTGAPIGKALPGRGYPKLAKPAQEPSYARGEKIYAEACALCHGDTGQGTKANGKYVFPPLWGKDAYNWGAGMHRVNTAAGFIKANMPYSQGGSLSDQQAWDVALFINSHERPADPRQTADLANLDKTFHKHQCTLGDEHDGHVLGSGTH